jgi:hypothetical protein
VSIAIFWRSRFRLRSVFMVILDWVLIATSKDTKFAFFQQPAAEEPFGVAKRKHLIFYAATCFGSHERRWPGPFNSQDLQVPGATGGSSASVFASFAGRIEKPCGVSRVFGIPWFHGYDAVNFRIVSLPS